MKNIRGLCLALALAAAFALSILYFRAAPNPVFEGRPASEWTGDLLSPDYAVRGRAQSALKGLGADSVPQLRNLLRARNGPWDDILARLSGQLRFLNYQPRDAVLARARAAEMLATLGPEARAATPDLVNALAFQESETERALARIGSEAVPGLLRALRHRHPVIRERSARLLGTITPIAPETVVALTRIAGDSSPEVRIQVAASLGRSIPVEPAALEALLGLAGDPEERVRAAGIKSLARAPKDDLEVAATVRERLADPSLFVELEAAKALWALTQDAPAVVPVLSGILATTEGWQAAYALGEIGPRASAAIPKLIEVLRKETVPRPFRTPPSSAFALGKIGPAAIPALAPVLADANARTRMSALMALGFMGASGKPAVPEVLRLLRDRDPEVRHTAALVLAMLGAEKEQMIDGLSECLAAEDIFMRFAAAQYLREIAPEQDWLIKPE